MSLEGTGALATDFVGVTQNAGDTTLTLRGPLSAAWPTSGLVSVNVSNTELERATISGTTLTMITGGRAYKPLGNFTTAQTHPAGDVVTLVADWTAMSNVFPQKIDEASGTDFPAASLTFPLHGSAFPASGSLEIIYDLRSTSATTTFDVLQLQFNGDVAGNYGAGQIYNSSASTTAYSEAVAQTTMTVGLVVGGGAVAGWSAKGRILIPNHAGATIKQIIGNVSAAFGSGAAGTNSRQIDGDWNSTAAITSIKLLSSAGSLAANSLISVYRWP